MAITFRAASLQSWSNATVSTLNHTLSSSFAVGDLMILAIALNTTSSPTFTLPSGWVQQSNPSVTNSPCLAVFTKVATAPDIGATITVSWSVSATVEIGSVSYSGVDATTPIDAKSDSASVGSVSTTCSLTAPLNDTLVSIVAAPSTNPGTPTGFTARFNSGNADFVLISDKQWSAGATGAVTSTQGSNAQASALLALRPAQIPAIRDNSNSLAGSAATGTGNFNLPSPIDAGDLILLFLTIDTIASPTTPAGFTKHSTLSDTTHNGGIAVYYKIAGASDAGASVSSITWTPTANFVLGILVVSGVDNTTPFDTPVAPHFQAGSGSAVVVSNSYTPASSSDLIIAAFGGSTNGTFVGTPPPGMTNVLTNSVTGNGQGVFVEGGAAAGTAIGTRSATNGAGSGFAGIGLVFGLKAASTPTMRGAAIWGTGNSVSTSTFVVEVPANAQSGDVLVAHLLLTGLATVTPPVGWTQVGTPNLNYIPQRWTFTKVAASEPASYNFALSTPVYGSTACYAVVGGKIDQSVWNESSSSSSIFTGGMTNTGSPDLLVNYVGLNSTAAFASMAGEVSVVDTSTQSTTVGAGHQYYDQVLAYEMVTGTTLAARNGTITTNGPAQYATHAISFTSSALSLAAPPIESLGAITNLTAYVTDTGSGSDTVTFQFSKDSTFATGVASFTTASQTLPLSGAAFTCNPLTQASASLQVGDTWYARAVLNSPGANNGSISNLATFTVDAEWTDQVSTTSFDRLLQCEKAAIQLSDGTLVFIDSDSSGSGVTYLKYSSTHTGVSGTIATLGTWGSTYQQTMALCRDSLDNLYVVGSSSTSPQNIQAKAFTKGAGYTWTAQTALTAGATANSSYTLVDAVWCSTGGGTGSKGHILMTWMDNLSGFGSSILDAGVLLAGTGTLVTQTTVSPVFMTGQGGGAPGANMDICPDGFGATNGIIVTPAGTTTVGQGRWAVGSSGTLTTNAAIGNWTGVGSLNASTKVRAIRYAPNRALIIVVGSNTGQWMSRTMQISTGTIIQDNGNTNVGSVSSMPLNGGSLNWDAFVDPSIPNLCWLITCDSSGNVWRLPINLDADNYNPWSSRGVGNGNGLETPFIESVINGFNGAAATPDLRAVKEPVGSVVDWQVNATQSGGNYALVGSQTPPVPTFVDRMPYLRANTSYGTASTTPTPLRPGKVVSGDLLVAVVWGAVSNTAMTVSSVPSGWTLRASITGTWPNAYLYTKVAGSSEPDSYSWTCSTNAFTELMNFGQATYEQVVTATGGGTSVTWPAVTTTSDNDVIYYITASQSNNGVRNPAVENMIYQDPWNFTLANVVPGKAGAYTASASSWQSVLGSTAQAPFALVLSPTTPEIIVRPHTPLSDPAAFGYFSSPQANFAIVWPSSTKIGDQLFVVFESNGPMSTVTFTPPSGWSLVGRTADPTNFAGMALFTRVANQNGAISENWTTSGYSGGSVGLYSQILCYTNVKGIDNAVVHTTPPTAQSYQALSPFTPQQAGETALHFNYSSASSVALQAFAGGRLNTTLWYPQTSRQLLALVEERDLPASPQRGRYVAMTGSSPYALSTITVLLNPASTGNPIYMIV